MISVDEALERIFALLTPLETETIPLRHALGRTVLSPVAALRTQPPFDASAMDGYAIATKQASPGDQFTVVGESAAGHAFDGVLQERQAVRIFTGALVPLGGHRVVIQEDVRVSGDTISLSEGLDTGLHIRPAGQDFTAGQEITFKDPLRPVDLALLAALGHGTVAVTRKPKVAIIATGDELVAPGEVPGPAQIVASNHLGLAALVERAGAEARLLPIARDTKASLGATFDLARGSDLIVTIGGASVGDHDLVADVAAARGLERSFYKIAMRPGKPLMAGRLDGIPMIGVPGNPVSSMVCGEIFIRPAIDMLLGRAGRARTTHQAPLARPIGPNGAREHYMRATLCDGALTIAERQDSSLLSVLAHANALVRRPPNDKARAAGDRLDYIAI
ncbi:molybdopterin molybdotransferase MoeA [Maribius pontilimi]|uniref:Molybdopterin molybdenumtransferase n=1 Tax=Palleronia pontilimi TaxID=1964209 RepID=A0A934ICG6_9RHOB|nr:molybdopterin molybdotransferase MoeA [Palleronia pontilimi]